LNTFKAIACHSPEDLHNAAKEIVEFAGDLKIWSLEGEMGAGKTTFVRGICKFLEVTDHVSSPTFSIVNEYRLKDNQPVYHFDFYRIHSESEALDLGYEEYFYSGNYCFIEWPSKIETLMPPDILKITIQTVDLNSRIIHISKNI
jgi:tRNA threonylcarbamoyladenosine biosynthesis protein TsaE